MKIEDFKKYLEYDPDTGLLTKKTNYGCIYLNNKTGYLFFAIKRKHYRYHRICWAIHYNKWPVSFIDHINGNKTDNRITNLKDCENRENQQNQKRHREGKLVGANYHKRSNVWRSRIKINGKQLYLGSFKTEKEAHEAYLIKLSELKGGDDDNTVR